MKYTVLCSFLLLGVCFGSTLEKGRYTHDEREGMNDMKTEEESSQKQSYDSENYGYDSQKRSYDYQRQDYDSQKRSYDYQRQDYDSQRQGYDSQRQGYDSQRQGYDAQKPRYDSRSREYDFQKQSSNSQKQSFYTLRGFDWQQRDNSNQLTEKDMGKPQHVRMVPDIRRPQAFSFTDLGKKFGDYIRGIFGRGSNESYVAKVFSNEMPSFVDPLDIGSLNTTFLLINTKYNDVQLYGLKNAYEIIMEVDTKNHKIVTQIPLNKVEFKGYYTYSSQPKHNFTVMLTDAVYVQTTPYTLKDNVAQLGNSSGHIQYSQENSFYDRIGFFGKIQQGQLGKHLVTSVTPQLYEYMGPKLSQLLERTVPDVTQNFQRAQIVAGLQTGINETFKEIRTHLAGSGNAKVELTSQNSPKYQYQGYTGQMTSISLENLRNFTLVGNKVTYTDSMVHAAVNMSLYQPMISTDITYSSQSDSQQREMHVQYLVDSIRGGVELHKDLSGGQLQLVGVKVYVSRVRVAPSQGHYEGDLDGLVKLFGSKLQHFVELGLEDFLTTQVTGILARVNSEEQGFPQSALKKISENAYSGKGEDAEHGQYSGNGYSDGQYSGNGRSDMGQYGNEHKSTREYSNDKQYPGKME